MCFVYPSEQNTHFFRLQLMDYIGDWSKFHTEFASFLIFWVTKKKVFTSPLIIKLFIIRLLLNSFDFRSCSSESRKRYTLRNSYRLRLHTHTNWDTNCCQDHTHIHIKLQIVVDVSRSAEGMVFVFLWDWEGVCRKLLSLVKLYQRFWIWKLNQNLNMAVLIQKQSPGGVR